MMLEGNVFITGGAGYLGRAILRRAEREAWPAKFTVYNRHEDALDRLRQRYPDVRRINGDISNLMLLAAAMAGHDIVIHAAASKFVPEAEENVISTVENNVNGSINVTNAANIAGVGLCIGVSTDKAVDPVNLYGTTKRVMESVFAEAARIWPRTAYAVARYGNVIASTGSIVPVFRQQLKAWGHVNVTDPDMTRFWMTPDDAVDTILEAVLAAQSMRGCIISPLAGSMAIGDIARVIAGEAPIAYIGPRPGEKTHEKLISDHEAVRTVSVRGGMYHLTMPSTFGPATDHRITPYSSDQARFTWTAGEMARAIADAETV